MSARGPAHTDQWRFRPLVSALFLGLALGVAHGAPPPSPSTGGSPGSSAGTSPGNPASAPSTNAPSSAPSATGATGTERIVVKVPAGGSYLTWVEGRGGVGPVTTAPTAFTGAEASLTLPKAPEGLQGWRVYVLDQKSGYSATKELSAGKDAARELNFTAPDFSRVHRVRILVTGAGDKPIASGTVALSDASGAAASRVLDPSAAGIGEFTDVPAGKARVTVTPSGGGSTTKEVEIGLPRGEAAQTIPISLPEVTQVVESAAPAASVPAANTPAGASPSTPPAGTAETPAATTAPTNAPAPVPQPPPPSGSGLSVLVGFLILAGIGYGVYVMGRNRGWTLDKGLARLGIQTGPEPAAVTAGARPAPPPPPVVDPNVCPFCGERKDPVTGRCSCSVDAQPGSSTAPFGAAPVGGSGPRLVAMQGTYMGQIYALSGEMTIGREATNGIPMENDVTVSRRHATVTPADGGYRIQDLGSSNGTFVNGSRVTEATLRPGDEISIGGTRFRFEM